MAELIFNPDLTTEDVLEKLRQSGKPLQEWGRAVDGTPMLAARTGGDKQPAIFITAGSHCTETAGVHSALNLLEMLDTEHEVHVLPLRDPFGFGGVNHCLSFATGQPVWVASHLQALETLQEKARLLWSEGELHLFLLGEIGFLWHSLKLPSESRFISMHSRMLKLATDEPGVLEPLRGRRVMLLNAMPDVEGTGEIGRCWQAVVSASGEWLHLNRFFGREDAPGEVAAVDQILQRVRPGLTLDLHEGNGSGFWMPVERNEKYTDLLLEMTQAFFDYIHTKGYPVTDYENWAATDETVGKNYTPNWLIPEPRLPGMFWVKGQLRGEGYNLMDYAAKWGIGYGTESPMERPLAMRVEVITHGILESIRVWEKAEK